MANLLQLLGLAAGPAAAFGTSAQQIRPIQSIDPNTGLPVSGPIINGVVPPPAPEAPQPEIPASAGVPTNLLEGTPYDQSNVLQAIGGSPDAPQPAPVPQAPQPAAPTEAPRSRRSLLDTVGRISDVLARVGGAEALYQPTLDAREDRSNMLQDRTREIDLDALRRQIIEQQIAAGGDEATDRGTARLGSAVRGLQAIQRRGGDIAAAWPILARQAGIPEDRATALGQIFTQDPQAVEAIAAMTGQDREFGLQPFYAQGPDGQLRAYQLGKDGSIQPVQLGEGETPIDPLKFVDTGGAQVGVGSRSGSVRRVLPNSVDPNTRANIGSRERIAAAGNASRERVASTRSAGKQDGGSSGMVETAQGNLNELREIYGELRDMGALVSPNQSTGANIAARARASGLGQMVEGTVGTEAQARRDRIASIRPALLQSIAQATGMTGRQLDSNADVKLFMQTVTDPSASYEANMAAIAGLERFLAAHANKAPAAAPRATPRTGGGPRVVPRAQSRGGASAAPQGGNAAAIAEARRRGLIP